MAGVADAAALAGLAGAALALAGLATAGWAAWQLRVAGTPVRPAAAPRVLVEEGPYRFSRNPMVLGLAAVLAGVPLALGCAAAGPGRAGLPGAGLACAHPGRRSAAACALRWLVQ